MSLKTLIIAEKPSVAADLARVLGKVPKKGDYYENDTCVISSAVGHLVELYMPEDMDASLKRWTLKDLPIVPKTFKLKPIERTKAKFQELKKLINRKDIGTVVNACDAGREGELIFTYINELAGGQKPVKRLWMSSMTPDAIRKAYAALRDGEELRPLQDAARSRSEADWLIGINGTRGTTVMFGRRGGGAATVGRVQTPTLSLVYQRELEIRNFTPRDFWRITADFSVHSGSYTGVYQKPDFKKGGDEHDRADRLWEEPLAQHILEEIKNTPQATVSEEKKRTRQAAPRLYDLTSLQREANSRYGFPAGMTLNIAQALYEKHKMITYPRTDSRALPGDYGPTVSETLGKLEAPYDKFAQQVLEQQWVRTSDKRVFNDAQVSDHFAIIPTGVSHRQLQEKEEKIYDMIVRRFIAVFYPSAEFDVTTRLTSCGKHTFKTEGKVLAIPGWLDVYGRASQDKDNLTPISPEDGNPPSAQLKEATLEHEQTRPPPRYNEATLLAAMEGAGKLVEDEELAEAMKEKGLGTPATRAATIDHLVKENYMERQGRDLYPTPKAEGLMEFLKTFDIEMLTSPALTGEWEYKLRQIEEKQLTREQFMQGIIDVTRDMIAKLGTPPPKEESSIISPFDGTSLLEDHRSWHSRENITVRGREIPKIAINKVIGNRKLEAHEVAELLSKRELGPVDGFVSRSGKTFSAILRLAEKDNGTFRVEFDFGNENADGSVTGEEVDFSQYPVVGNSPIDGSPVYETPNAYVSESRGKDGKPSFRLGRNMLGKALTSQEVSALLKDRKSPLIKGFRSNRTKRLFDAFLILKENGSIGFEFPPRPAKKAAKQATSEEAGVGQ